MEPLFLAVICGCQACLFRDALHEVYLPRIQRGRTSFAAKMLGARRALLSILAHFYEHGRWGSLVQGTEGQSLTAEDQLFVLMQSGQYLTATRGMGTPEAQICYERAERLCYSLDRPLLLYLALAGQWEYSLMTEKLKATMQIAKRVYSLAEEQKVPALMAGACTFLAVTLYYMGDFDSARQHAIRAVQIWRSSSIQSAVDMIDSAAAPVVCLAIDALSQWHLGEIASSKVRIAEAISLAKKSNDLHALALALVFAAFLPHVEGNPVEVERLASEAIELSTRQNFAQWLRAATVYRGWARSASGHTDEGISLIEAGMRIAEFILTSPYSLAIKAEALHQAGRTSEALEAVKEAEAIAERSGERWFCAELHRLRGVLLATIGADETQIEASFREAVRIAREQKSVSLEKRAEATYAEYRCRKEQR
jgi:tetratricopeptide (TPR) repeat protein